METKYSMLRTRTQNSLFHTLLTQHKLDKEEKRALVSDYTNGRTTSSAEMTFDEMTLAIKHLKKLEEQSIKRMRAKIINIARDIFGLVPGDEFSQRDYNALNTFLMKRFKSPLHKLTYEQLPPAVTGMEAWRDSSTKKLLRDILSA